jgi:PAS domain S-box-containing protein
MRKLLPIGMAFLVLAGLYASSLYNYLLFHSLAEVFSIIIACGIFMVAWNSRRFLDNQYLLFIGIAYLFIGALDLAHTFSYKGMQILFGYGANAPTQLWIAARYVESLTLLVAPLMFRRRFRPAYYILGYSVLVSLLLLSIFYWRTFPDCFLIHGGGLTPFKRISEYVISAILMAAGGLIIRCRHRFEPTVLRWLLVSIALTILSELAFTSYASVYGATNMLGHFLKIASFYCVYKAIIETGLARPYELLFRDLNQSKERYRSLFVHMINGFASHEMVFDDHGNPSDYVFLEVNEAFAKLTGLTDVVGKRVTEVLPGIQDDPADWIGAYGRVATTGHSARYENYSEKLKKWYSVTAYRPSPGQFATVFEDVTQRKVAEEELRRQREWLRVILSSIGDAVIATDAGGRITFLNPVAATLTGWQGDDALGRPIATVFRTIDERSGEPGGDIAQRVLDQGCVVTLANHTALIARDGRRIPIEDSAAPIREADGRTIGVVLVFHDVAAKREAQGALRASEARFKLLSDTAGRLLAAENPQGIVNELCRAVMEHLDCQAFFNFLVDDTCGRLHLNACAGIAPEEVAKIQWLDFGVAVCGCVARDRQRMIAEDILNSSDPRTELVRSYGIQAYCCHPLMVQGRLIGTLSFGTKGRPGFKTDEVELMRTVADQVALAMQRIQNQQTLRDANEALEGKVQERTAALARTVETLEEEIRLRERAESKLRLANKELADRAEQLRALTGQLTMAEQRERMRLSKILHDGLQQYLAIAKLQLSSISDQTDRDDLKQAACEIETLIGESIQMSRSLSTELSPPVLYEGGLAAGLEWLARWMRDKHAFDVALTMDAIAELPEDVKVLVFESVRELLFNAVKHAAVSRAEVILRQMNGTGVRITVRDEGVGFDMDRLKPVGDYGGCFGLFSIRERLGLIGGHFEIDSAPGEGSRFNLTLPFGLASPKMDCSDPPPVPLDPERSAPDAQHQAPAIRVLIADDHSLFRDGVARLVNREADISVIGQACDGQEAIELTRRLMPDVILMDVNMPGINGIEATRSIHQESPQIRIIGLSMHEDPDHAAAMRTAGAVGYQNKDCAAAELVFAIRACVGSECGLTQ